MGSRGQHGGLARASFDALLVLDVMGYDTILVETVGVGQSELDIARLADTSAVVLVPESGDAIQTLKAGVSKADADAMKAKLEAEGATVEIK